MDQLKSETKICPNQQLDPQFELMVSQLMINLDQQCQLLYARTKLAEYQPFEPIPQFPTIQQSKEQITTFPFKKHGHRHKKSKKNIKKENSYSTDKSVISINSTKPHYNYGISGRLQSKQRKIEQLYCDNEIDNEVYIQPIKKIGKNSITKQYQQCMQQLKGINLIYMIDEDKKGRNKNKQSRRNLYQENIIDDFKKLIQEENKRNKQFPITLSSDSQDQTKMKGKKPTPKVKITL